MGSSSVKVWAVSGDVLRNREQIAASSMPHLELHYTDIALTHALTRGSTTLAELPVLDARAAEEIIGYDPASSLLLELVLATLVIMLVLGLPLGGLAARAGGAPILIGAARVTFWGALAMALTAQVGRVFGQEPVAPLVLAHFLLRFLVVGDVLEGSGQANRFALAVQDQVGQ